MIKLVCPVCGYIIRTTRKWLGKSGAPTCPTCKVDFEEDQKDE